VLFVFFVFQSSGIGNTHRWGCAQGVAGEERSLKHEGHEGHEEES
jgi:hypothetical protein